MVNQLSPQLGGSEWEAASCNGQMGVLADSSLMDEQQLETAEQAAGAHQLMKEMKRGYARPVQEGEVDGELYSKQQQQQHQQQQMQLMQQAQQAHQVMHAVKKGYQSQLDQQEEQGKGYSGSWAAAAAGINPNRKCLAAIEPAGQGGNGMGVAERAERLIHGDYVAAGRGDREQHGISENDAQLYGELAGWVRAGGGGLRGEAILEKLLGELGGARASAAAERGEIHGLRAALIELQGSTGAEHLEKVLLNQQLVELKGQLEVASKGLEEAVADRDLFLRRLQQLEEEGGEQPGDRRPTKLDVQRAKAHAAQVRWCVALCRIRYFVTMTSEPDAARTFHIAARTFHIADHGIRHSRRAQSIGSKEPHPVPA